LEDLKKNAYQRRRLADFEEERIWKESSKETPQSSQVYVFYTREDLEIFRNEDTEEEMAGGGIKQRQKEFREELFSGKEKERDSKIRMQYLKDLIQGLMILLLINRTSWNAKGFASNACCWTSNTIEGKRRERWSRMQILSNPLKKNQKDTKRSSNITSCPENLPKCRRSVAVRKSGIPSRPL